jgi:two-component system, response regulator
MNEVEILLVDDNYDDRELALMALRKHKLANKIEVAHDGEEALDFLFCRGAFEGRDCTNPPKVVLLDIKMPKVDGLEVLRQLKADARTRSIPIVVMTSSAEQKDMVESYQLGVNSYVQKPVNFEKFQQIIKDLGYYWLVVNQAAPICAGGVP